VKGDDIRIIGLERCYSELCVGVVRPLPGWLIEICGASPEAGLGVIGVETPGVPAGKNRSR
jgi:hypothetical protein